MAQTLKPELRNQIIKSATAHFTARGLQKTTMRMISKDAGTSPGNLYRYIPSKQALYDELTGSTYERLKALAERLEQIGPGRGRMALEEVDTFLQIRGEEPTGLAILFANRNVEPMRSLIERFETLLSGQLSAGLIEEGKGDALVLGESMARGVMSALFHLLELDPNVSPETLRALIERMLAGAAVVDKREGEMSI